MITINEKKLKELCEVGATIALNKEAQESLKTLLEAQKRLEDAVAAVGTSIKESMEKEGLDAVEGELLKVVLSASGSRFVLSDQDEAPPEVLDIKLNTKAVDAWIENHNGLPNGVIEKDVRSTALRITIK